MSATNCEIYLKLSISIPIEILAAVSDSLRLLFLCHCETLIWMINFRPLFLLSFAASCWFFFDPLFQPK